MLAMTSSRQKALGMILGINMAASHAACTVAFAKPHTMRFGQSTISSEKDARTPAQQKINSQLLYEIYRRRGEARQKGIPQGKTDVRIDSRGRALVDVRAVPVSADLQKKIKAAGGIIESVAPEQHSIISWIPLLKLEGIAEDKSVRFIEPAAEPSTQR
jgi:hypothetical protein